MHTLRDALRTGLLFLACVAGLQVTYLLAQLSASAHRMETEFMETAQQAQATLLYSQAVLASLRGTTETVRRSAEQQMGYYEAVGRRSALALARLDLLIRHLDARTERITRAVEVMAVQTGDMSSQVSSVAAALGADAQEVSTQAASLLAASTQAVQDLNTRIADPKLEQIAEAMAASSQNTEQATANVAEATGYLRDMLSPKKKIFWRWLLELAIPRPTVGLK